MNPYSFKRFLQNPNRPKNPVQLVRSDSNCIVVYGDLPDCVRNGDAKVVSNHDNLSFESGSKNNFGLSDLSSPIVTLTSAQNGLITTLNNPAASISQSHSNLGTYDEIDEIESGHVNSVVPDVYPRNLENINVAQLHSNSQCLLMHTNTKGLDILPHTLPDFLIDQAANSDHIPSHPEYYIKQSVRETLFPCELSQFNSVPCFPYSNDIMRLRSHSEESVLINRLTRENILNQIDKRILSIPSDLNKSHIVCSAKSNSDFLKRLSLSDKLCHFTMTRREWEIVEPKIIEQQNIISTLLHKQTELESRLNKAYQAISERDNLIANLRAESEVKQNEAQLKIKSLELELATEKLNASKTRWMNLQLNNSFNHAATSSPSLDGSSSSVPSSHLT